MLDAETASALNEVLEFKGWKADRESGNRYAVVSRVHDAEASPHQSGATLDDAAVRPWLLPAVYERLRAGQGEFLTELRPAVAMFIKFDGIDYDDDAEAGAKLNRFVSWVQSRLARYEGSLIDVAIGDKGSYLYCTFGAPIAHENDAWCALTVALEVRSPPAEMAFIRGTRIGISAGTMRTGAYGGTTRRTYGVLGDDVNLAARLMESASLAQVLVSGRARNRVGEGFTWETLPSIKVKGKADAIPVFALLGASLPLTLRLIEPTYSLPMVGRTEELALLERKMELALSGRGQIVGITAEAGMGKSRLVAEVIRLASRWQLAGYGSQCQSYGTHTSYLAWWTVWCGLFGLKPDSPTEEQASLLAEQLRQIDPALLPRLPLLGAVVNLALPETDVTRSFDAKLRKASLEALLVSCLRHRAAQAPLLLVLEDCHWIDPLSADLLEVVARAIVNLPVMLVLAYRPPESGRSNELPIRQLPHFTEVALVDLKPEEAERLIASKLNQLYGSTTPPPRALVERLTARSQGNPFYLEELLSFLQDENIDPQDAKVLEGLELPASLHSLILSRIDKLLESQRITLKVASVIGRLFQAETIWGVNQQLNEQGVRQDLEALKKLDLTPLDKPDPELTYLFKHIVTQEVAYESLAYSTRTALHNEIGLYLERRHARALEQQVDLLAFHFDRSDNEAKKREYLLKAGEAAQARYANSAAINYYQRVLPLLSGEERITVMLKLGKVLELVGNWEAAGNLYDEALSLAQAAQDRDAQGRCQTATGEWLRKRGNYGEAAEWLEAGRTLFKDLGNEAGVAETLHVSGTVAAQQGAYDKACALYQESLGIRRRLDDKPHIASLLSNLGIVSWYRGDFPAARALYEEGLAIRRELGDRWSIANSLNNLGLLLRDQGDVAAARSLLEESLAINHELGDRWSVANCLSSLGDVALSQGDHAAARAFLEESLAINQELGDRTAIAFVFEFFASLAAATNEPARAQRLAGAAAALRELIGSPLSPAEHARLVQTLDAVSGSMSETERAVSFKEGREMTLEQAVAYALKAETDAG
jgi:class 3 adenylate cyclase/tetratricopeptide (TPR) repeat protein